MSSVSSRAPTPLLPVPSERQLAWHRQEMYAFCHFGMNTFTGREWGEGTESPELFRPTELDCRQWARVLKDAGFRGIIITAKHHDGFCLWPSRYTTHSVAHTPWGDGKRDVVAELAAACREYGLKFGVYLSPWDRHEPTYGDSPRYNEHYENQLTELLTNYGEVFEVWWDGACGEGPNGKRQEYDWKAYEEVVRRLQPNAVIFSDAGPDVRWVGNEQGFAGETNWCMQRRDDFAPGRVADLSLLTHGQRDGTHWVPAECDVSIRPGWFYQAEQDAQVKSVEQLVDIYFKSVGRNASLLLNVPPDRRGLIADVDVQRLHEFGRALEAIFARDLAREAKAVASSVRGGDARFAAERAIDGLPGSYWATDEGVLTGSLTVTWREPVQFGVVMLQEQIELGQRVEKFSIEARVGGHWIEVAQGTTIGYKRLLRFSEVTADGVRVNILGSRACPTLSTVSVFAPPSGP
ncbi:MAG: hypothetical protein AMXMBFR61_19540 [Fimbriimonadales bacterium]